MSKKKTDRIWQKMIALYLMKSSKPQTFLPIFFLLTWSQSFKIMPTDSIFDVLSSLKRLFQQQDNGEREKTCQ